MINFCWFLGITGIVVMAVYLVMRPYILIRVERWQQEQEAQQHSKVLELRTHELRDEALADVLSQIAQHNSQGRRAA